VIASKFSNTSGWIRGGVIDANKLPITGIRLESTGRCEIADLVVINATYKGIHFLKGGYETNLTRIRVEVEKNTHCLPGSIGIHYENGDCKANLVHIIGYETHLRSDSSSNWFSMVHAWIGSPLRGHHYNNFYCNGTSNSFNQCYADSPTNAGFYITQPHQTFVNVVCTLVDGHRTIQESDFLSLPMANKELIWPTFCLLIKNTGWPRHSVATSGGSVILGNSCWEMGFGGMENRIFRG